MDCQRREWIGGGAGCGRSNLLNFLSHRPEVLQSYLSPEAGTVVLIPVDLNNLPAEDPATMYLVILRAFYWVRPRFNSSLEETVKTLYLENRATQNPFLAQSALHELLFAFQAERVRVVLVLNHFDRFCQVATPQMLNTLRGLRDSFKESILPLVVGNPAAPKTAALLPPERAGLGPLPFAAEEATAIAALYGVEPFLGPAATEQAVRRRVRQAGLVHPAAHGTYNPVTPLNSFIALAPDERFDGRLTVGEVFGLELQPVDLVVLSACQTQLGEVSRGDDVIGLTRAFFFAGAPTVVASLWNVDDQATGQLMKRFYTHLSEGQGKAEALRQAQLEILAEPQTAAPCYWAAFAMSGRGGDTAGHQAGSPSG